MRFRRIEFATDELALIREMAQAAEIGGASHLRPTEERRVYLREDQLIGQLGTAAFHKWYYGDLAHYHSERQARNASPFEGDGGSDLEGLRVDVKTSLWRNQRRDVWDYHLWVRVGEVHDNWYYVLAIVPPDQDAALLMGWARTSELSADADGRLMRQARDLHELPEQPRRRHV